LPLTLNIDDDQFVENVGYSFKKQKKNTRFPVKVKEYLNKLFEIGEISGKKASPYTVDLVDYGVTMNIFQPTFVLFCQQLYHLLPCHINQC
jgi:hypothetical protein